MGEARRPTPGGRPGEGGAAGVVGPVVRDLTARRLARAGIPLVLLLVAGLVALVVEPSAIRWGVVVGGPVAALALLALGMRGVERAHGEGESGWSAVPQAVWLVPWGYGVFVLGWPGLLELRDAVATRSPVRGAASLLFVALAVALLRAASRVGEVSRLGGVMGIPGAGETGSRGEGP